MKAYLVDTNILLDVIGADIQFGERSKNCLTRCAVDGVLVIDPVIYAEVGAVIASIEELDELLPRSLFRRDPMPWEACYLAGRALHRYRSCGGSRNRVLADFLIGAHATVAGMDLITRDRGYARYFEISIVDPSVKENPRDV
jgi:predicted nucleic acid-binding protein